MAEKHMIDLEDVGKSFPILLKFELAGSYGSGSCKRLEVRVTVYQQEAFHPTRSSVVYVVVSREQEFSFIRIDDAINKYNQLP